MSDQEDHTVEQRAAELLDRIKTSEEIIRRSVVTGDLEPFKAILNETELELIQVGRLEAFRDYLITKRQDLRDLAPAARERLRASTLATENPLLKSSDYRAAELAGGVPHCVDCKYFVAPPNDGSPDGDKACTSFGTRGADVACFGFTDKISDATS